MSETKKINTAYNSTGGIQISFQGVYNSTGGIQIYFQGVYNPVD